ncbi:MAG: hypothetical protein JSS70_15865 [Bacteroidetes bacterium]|nr:hypothetical protein [Bacteroidota bacterium]
MKKIQLFSMLLTVAFATISLTYGCRNKSSQEKQTEKVTGEFQFREKLSAYNFFTGNINELKPNTGLINYELATPLFTDYAVKDRFIVLPKGKLIQYTVQGAFNFPDSTIIIKNFAYRNTDQKKIMIETRLLVKDPYDSKWKVMNYLWNKEQTDAIKHITGARLPITLLDDHNNAVNTIYQVPNTNDCKRCHVKNDILTPIGPKARNLNFTRSGATGNQLTEWAASGYLAGLPEIEKVQRLPDWKDERHFSLNERARAYLDVNCAHCHTPGGDAYNTGLFLEYEQTDINKLGFMKAPVSAGGGAGGLDYDIVPGDAAHSVLAYRMNSTEPGTAMPELARTVIHKEAVQLIKDWINHLPKDKK